MTQSSCNVVLIRVESVGFLTFWVPCGYHCGGKIDGISKRGQRTRGLHSETDAYAALFVLSEDVF